MGHQYVFASAQCESVRVSVPGLCSASWLEPGCDAQRVASCGRSILVPLVTLLQSSYSSLWIADRLLDPRQNLCARHRQRQNRRPPRIPVHKVAAPRVASCMQCTLGELGRLGQQRTAAAGGFAGPALCAVQLCPSRNSCSCKIVGIRAAIHAGIATRRQLSSGDPFLCHSPRGIDRAPEPMPNGLPDSIHSFFRSQADSLFATRAG